MRVCLIEDHPDLASLIQKGMKSRDISVDIFGSEEDGLAALELFEFDAVVLDLGLPDQDGMSVLKTLRAEHPSVPVIILTARVGIPDIVGGLDAGADDYMTKPFEMDVLAARLRALLRRPRESLGTTLNVANVQLDCGTREVRVDGKGIPMPRRETEGLELLMRRVGQAVPKTAIEQNLYGLGETLSSNSVEVLIHRLRRRLKAANAKAVVETRYGIGYALIAEENS